MSDGTGREQPQPLADTLAVDLSGGGVRTALCSIGLLYWLQGRGDWPRVRRIVSVSGGSLVSGVLADRQPADGDAMVAEMVGLFHRLTNRWRVAATFGAMGGALGWLVLAGVADSARIDRWGVGIAIATVLWLVCLGVVRVVYTPILLMSGCLVVAWVDLEQRDEWIALGVVLVVVPLAVFACMVWLRSRRLGLSLFPEDSGEGFRRALRRLWGLAGVQAAVALGLVAVGVVDAVRPHDPGALRSISDVVRTSAWVMVGATVLWVVIVPLVVRAHLSYLVGRDRTEPPAAATGAWNILHAICAADLREDAANFFLLAPNGTRVLVSEPIDALASPRLAGAGQVPLVTMLQASSAFIPVLQPVVPLTTTELDVPGTARWDPPLRAQVLADGGIHGTLGDQVDLLRLDTASRWAFLGAEEPDRRITIDAARYRASSPAFWPLMMIPILGPFVVQLRVMQMLLRGVVTAERREDDAVAVRVTGARFADPFTVSETRATDAARLLAVLREQVDRTGSWWPSPRRGLRCAAAAVAAATLATEPATDETLNGLRTRLSELEALLGLPGELGLTDLIPLSP